MLLVPELKLKHVISRHHQTAENTTHHSHGSNHINSGCSRHRKNSHTHILLFLLTVCGNRTGDGTYRGLYVMNSVVCIRTCTRVPAQKPAAPSEHLKMCFIYIRLNLCNPCWCPIGDLQEKFQQCKQ